MCENAHKNRTDWNQLFTHCHTCNVSTFWGHMRQKQPLEQLLSKFKSSKKPTIVQVGTIPRLASRLRQLIFQRCIPGKSFVVVCLYGTQSTCFVGKQPSGWKQLMPTADDIAQTAMRLEPSTVTWASGSGYACCWFWFLFLLSIIISSSSSSSSSSQPAVPYPSRPATRTCFRTASPLPALEQLAPWRMSVLLHIYDALLPDESPIWVGCGMNFECAITITILYS